MSYLKLTFLMNISQLVSYLDLDYYSRVDVAIYLLYAHVLRCS